VDQKQRSHLPDIGKLDEIGMSKNELYLGTKAVTAVMADKSIMSVELPIDPRPDLTPF
jgi:hypothetical protein